MVGVDGSVLARYRTQTRSFWIWTLVLFFVTFLLACGLSKFLKRHDVGDLIPSTWIVIPPIGQDVKE